MNLKDAMRSLGLLKINNLDEVRKTYRKLALKYHPDHNPGNNSAEEKFRELKDAYDYILETYKDEDLEVTNPGVFDQDFESDSPTDSVQKNKTATSQPLNLRYVLHLDIHEAAEGCSKTIQYIRQSIQQKTETVRISVAVPAGVIEGQKLRVQGEGARDGVRPAGDLIVIIKINTHPLFTKEGRNIKMDLPLTLAEVLFGCEKSIPTLYGFSTLKIPPGSKSGQILRLKNKGFPRLEGFGKGDFLVRILIDLPLDLTSEEKFLIQKISAKSSPLIEEYESILKKI